MKFNVLDWYCGELGKLQVLTSIGLPVGWFNLTIRKNWENLCVDFIMTSIIQSQTHSKSHVTVIVCSYSHIFIKDIA